jgi:hypothetical protein
MRHRPHPPAAPGAWPKRNDHEGRGTPRGPRCRPSTRGIRSPRRPAAPAGLHPRPLPSFSSRCLCDAPILRLQCQRSLPMAPKPHGQAALQPRRPRNPHSPPWSSTRPPPRSGRVRKLLRVSPDPGRRGSIFPPPPGKVPPDLTPASETRPASVRRPGRWRLRATDAGTAPSPEPAGQPPDGPPKECPGLAPEAPEDRWRLMSIK